ncbi:ribonuclease P protein component [Lysinibacter sp. HNR]|uniref:ribonuclease P protein component n=1 Tax=Lysinibacter sp. HNR TaxID=3031408 RepID=UPI002435E0B7|nr:ribonuclease P protein component [Lysinibacter sp. HNR]WGD37342.1 ribonuclease P protein component [Lysinibacter sp. HNR]
MLSNKNRIKSAADYRQTVRRGERFRGRYCVCYAIATEVGKPARFGFIVSRSVGMAHTRNLIRRRLKAISAEILADGVSAVDVVYRAHPGAALATYSELRRDLISVVARIRLVSDSAVKAVES